MRFCKDCIHYRAGGSCDRDVYTVIEPIEGLQVLKGRRRAHKERGTSPLLSVFIGRCGKQGAFYRELG